MFATWISDVRCINAMGYNCRYLDRQIFSRFIIVEFFNNLFKFLKNLVPLNILWGEKFSSQDSCMFIPNLKNFKKQL